VGDSTTVATPILNSIGDRQVIEGHSLTFTATVSNPAPDRTLTFSLDPGAPASATIDAATGVFRWTPLDGPAQITVTVRVSDAAAPAATSTEMVHIEVANAAPVVALGTASQSLVMGQALALAGSFSDPGADTWFATVDYGDGSGPVPLSISGGKTFVLNHIYSAPGSFRVLVTVADKDGGIGAGSLEVNVVPPPVRVTAVSLRVFKRKANDILMTFNGPLNVAAASNLANYRLVSAGRDKKFGDRDDRVMPLRFASHINFGSSSEVDLVLRALPVSKIPERLTLNAVGLTDTLGRPLDGDGDGQPGGNSTAVLRGKSVTIPAAQPKPGSLTMARARITLTRPFQNRAHLFAWKSTRSSRSAR
jgi:hypothetical protein